MSALPGGDADKQGNRYEDWWTLLRLADLLGGTAARMRLEPPGPAGEGIEFWIDEPNGRWCEQAKDAPAGGTWTVHRLIERKVLARVQQHLADGHHVRLVLSTAAQDLSSLTERARKGTTAAEFHDHTLTLELRGELASVAKLWKTGSDDTWQLLRRLHVEHQPPEALQRLLLLRYAGLVHADPQEAVRWLRGWLTDHLQTELTGPLVWAALTKAGFRRALLPGDKGALAALARTLERHSARIRALKPTITVPQPAAQDLLDLLLDDNAPRVVVVHGRAGSGKSVVAADAVQRLHDYGWYAAAVTMDGGGQVRTAAGLGSACDLPASFASLLGGLAQGAPAVLLIDQLDAVSTYSGRMPDSFAAVAETLEEATAFRGLRVVLAVRTVDLHEDPRLRQLVADDNRATTLAVPDLGPAAVRQALSDAGFDPAALAPQTLELLCVPLHLAVFSRLSGEAQAARYGSLTALYERYTTETRRRLEQELGQLDWAPITSALVGAMSDRESLRVPDTVVDHAPVVEVNALISAGILEREDAQLRFFHETYFDFLFARAFVAGQRDLHEFLAASGQQLFRRGQTRQVLDYLAGTDRPAFRHMVAKLLASDQIRLHLKEVVATVLWQLVPEADDWIELEPLAFGSDPATVRLLTPLLSAGGWFDAADAAGRWPGYLSDAQTLDRVANQLVMAARERGTRVSALVAPHIGTSEVWRLVLRALVQWSTNPHTVDLAVSLMERGEIDDITGPIAVNADFFSIVYGLHKTDPAGAARLVGAYLRRGIARAAAGGSADPFDSGHIRDQNSGREIVRHLAREAPQAYAEHIGLPVIDILTATATPRAARPGLRRTTRSAFRRLEEVRLSGMLFTGLCQALAKLAASDPDVTAELMAPLAASDVEDLRFLACRTYHALGRSDLAVAFLLADEQNLQLGYSDSPRWASHELIHMAATGCTAVELAALTERLLWYAPAWERTAQALDRRGRSEYDLLSAIPSARQSNTVRRRLGELERKFPGGLPSPPQSNTMASSVGSPIRDAAAPHLTDRQWRRAIRRYATPETRPRDWERGGTDQLAGQLGQRAAEEPPRFAALALTFDATVPHVHFARIIEAVAADVDLPTLSALCAHSYAMAGSAALRAITDGIERARQANEQLLTLLELAAHADDPEEEVTSPEDLESAGLNGLRGNAARVVAVLWSAGPEHVSRLLPTVVTLAADPVLAVRVMAAEAVIALLRHQPPDALDVAETLLAGPEALYGASTIAQLLNLCMIRDAPRFARHLARALSGPEQAARHAGLVWAAGLVHGRLPADLPADLTELSVHARLGVAQQLARTPELALSTMLALLDDDDTEIREAAAEALRMLDQLDQLDAETLLSGALTTRCFAEHADDAFTALAHSAQQLPPSTLTACERAVEVIGPALGDIRTGTSMAARDMTTLVLRLYRQGGEDVRTRCLDLIDALTNVRAHGLNEQIDAVR